MADFGAKKFVKSLYPLCILGYKVTNWQKKCVVSRYITPLWWCVMVPTLLLLPTLYYMYFVKTRIQTIQSSPFISVGSLYYANTKYVFGGVKIC